MEATVSRGRQVECPSSAAEAAEMLHELAREGRSVRIAGGATKLGWGRPVRADVSLRTAGLDRIQEHNPGDLTAVLEAGVRLADAQAAFAEKGQRLGLDPPLGAADGATVGGVLATADSGPLRHRYGAVRDLVIGVTLALPDGTLARAGGKVIKNVAGYDLAKLSAGAFGTLGVVVQVAVRLHPLPDRTVSAAARIDDPAALARVAGRLAGSPLETDALDVAWRDGHGGVLARYGGAAAGEQARAAARLLAEEPGLEPLVLEDDEEPWAQQRAGQRAPEGVVVRVAGLPTDLEHVLQTADAAGAAVVGRAGVGTFWVTLPVAPLASNGAEGARSAGAAPAASSPEEAVRSLRETLSPRPCVVLDAPEALREAVDPWPDMDPGLLALSRRLLERFDPAGTANPGILAGGL